MRSDDIKRQKGTMESDEIYYIKGHIKVVSDQMELKCNRLKNFVTFLKRNKCIHVHFHRVEMENTEQLQFCMSF